MTNILPKIALAIASVITSFTIMVPRAQAEIVFWDLEFFSTTNNRVGTGEFSYDDTAPFEGTFPGPVFGSEVTITADDGWFSLLNFDANILAESPVIDGESISLNITSFFPGASLLAWVPPETDFFSNGISGGPRGVETGDPRGGGFPFTTERWLFGVFAPDINFLTIDADGSFELVNQNIPAGLTPAGFVSQSGTWTATQRPAVSPEPIPEPLTILASATAACTIPVLKREHKRKQKKLKTKV